MKLIEYISYSLSLIGLLLLFHNCGGDQTIEVTEEKLVYQNRIDTTLDKIERKLADLETIYQLEEKVDTAAVSDLAETEIEVKPIERVKMNLENLEDNLNRKLGEIDELSEEEWKNAKKEIDELLAQYDQIIARYEQIEGESKPDK